MLYTKENFLNLITTMTIKADIQITQRRIYNNTKVKTRLDDISVIRKMKKSKLPTVFRMNSMPYRVVIFNCIWGCFFVPCFLIETKLQFWKVKENCCYNLSRKHLKWNKTFKCKICKNFVTKQIFMHYCCVFSMKRYPLDSFIS